MSRRNIVYTIIINFVLIQFNGINKLYKQSPPSKSQASELHVTSHTRFLALFLGRLGEVLSDQRIECRATFVAFEAGLHTLGDVFIVDTLSNSTFLFEEAVKIFVQ